MDPFRPLRRIVDNMIIRRAETPGLSRSLVFRVMPATFRFSAFARALAQGRGEAASAIARADVRDRASDRRPVHGFTAPPFLSDVSEQTGSTNGRHSSDAAANEFARVAWDALADGDVAEARELSRLSMVVSTPLRERALRPAEVVAATRLRREMVGAGYASLHAGYTLAAETKAFLDQTAPTREGEHLAEVVLRWRSPKERDHSAVRVAAAMAVAPLNPAAVQAVLRRERAVLWEHEHPKEARALVGEPMVESPELPEARDVNRVRWQLLEILADAQENGVKVTENGRIAAVAVDGGDVVPLSGKAAERFVELRRELDANRADVEYELRAQRVEEWARTRSLRFYEGITTLFGTRPTWSDRDRSADWQLADRGRTEILELFRDEGMRVELDGSITGLPDEKSEQFASAREAFRVTWMKVSGVELSPDWTDGERRLVDLDRVASRQIMSAHRAPDGIVQRAASEIPF